MSAAEAGGGGAPRAVLAAPRAVLLDAMGTLLELEPPAPRLRKEMAGRFDIDVSEEAAREAMEAEIAYYRRHLDEGRDVNSLAGLRRRCALVVSRELAALTGVAMPAIGPMTEALLASLQFRRFAEVPAALRELRRRGLRLVVVSNWDVSLPDVLEREGVRPLVDGVVSSAEARARKPQAGIFARALSLAGVSARQAWHVGDSLDEDVAGAGAAGVQPVLIDRSGRSDRAEVAGVPMIASLTELVSAIADPAPVRE